jgi:AAHS family 4-hydroxybenzoate transporter-like MFS transporter
LTLLRFLTGLGLGGAMPNAITLSAEYCPERRRSSLVTLMFCGFTIGSAVGGLVVAQIVVEYGWRPVLVLGGVAPLALIPVLMLALPESARFLALRGRKPERIIRILQRIAPGENVEHVSTAPPSVPVGSPATQLFTAEFWAGTLLLWLTFFMSLLIVYLLGNWLPLLISNTGTSLRTASLITAMFQVGGTVGAIALGQLMDRLNPHHVLGVAYAVAAGFILLIGQAGTIQWLLVVAVFGAGFCVSGSQVGANALAASYYPTSSRATGVSWAHAVGRSGSVLGSMVGGVMLAMKLNMPTLFAVVAVPALIAAVSIVAMGAIGGRRAALATKAAI